MSEQAHDENPAATAVRKLLERAIAIYTRDVGALPGETVARNILCSLVDVLKSNGCPYREIAVWLQHAAAMVDCYAALEADEVEQDDDGGAGMTAEQDHSPLFREVRATLYKVGDGELDLDDGIASLSATLALFLSIHPNARSPEGLDRMVDNLAEGMRILATSFVIASAFNVPTGHWWDISGGEKKDSRA